MTKVPFGKTSKRWVLEYTDITAPKEEEKRNRDRKMKAGSKRVGVGEKEGKRKKRRKERQSNEGRNRKGVAGRDSDTCVVMSAPSEQNLP